MQRNRFLGQLLAPLFDRASALRSAKDSRDIYELCAALLSPEGEVSGPRLATEVLAHYVVLTLDEKTAFFHYLNDQLDIDAAKIADLATRYAQAPTTDLFSALCATSESPRQELLRRLNQPAGATAAIVAMRVDLLERLKGYPDLARTDNDFVHLLRSWFNNGFLVLQQIDWDTPARLLDKIVAYEAVHEIDDLDDLRRRLYPPDRRCFAFFHPAMPAEPLIFVELALTPEIAGSIDAVLSEDRDPLQAEEAKAAIFYSISNCQKGLRGISFGNQLIKQVVAALSVQFPQIEHFVTLSPLPGLTKWLETQTGHPEHGAAAQAMLYQTASAGDIRAIAARYLLLGKREDGLPIDQVARFHLGNGAQVYDLHADADLSANGRAQSCGVMVNYLYRLDKTESNHAGYALSKQVAASPGARALATATLTAKPTGTPE